jgi:branched-chain amino acid aminotransferase
MGEGLAFVGGQYCGIEDARISIFDPGFTHSDVVYDVTSTWNGSFFRLEDHIARFLRSCAGFELVCPYTPAELRRILAICVQRGGVADRSFVSMALTRGLYTSAEAAASRDIFQTACTLIAYAVPYKWIASPEAQARGWHMITAKTPRIPDACVDMRCKNHHWGDLTRGKFEARARGADCAVHLSIEGYLTEGAGFNVFFAKGGHLFTPARNILQGLTRQSVLDLADELGIPTEVGDFRVEALREADEAFITSTAGGVMPLARIDDRSFPVNGAGSLSVRLREEYWRRREEGWLATPVSDILGADAVSPPARALK